MVEEMITQLQAENFQSHKDLSLSFSPGITVIVGSSDQGKSAALRALLWVLTNQPSGTAVIRHGTKGAKVAVQLDSGEVVTRERKGTTVNEYRVQTGDACEVYKKPGVKEPPEDVARLLNISSVNIQKQLDPPFLLSASPPEVARVLNRVARIDNMDSAMQNAASGLRETKSDIRRVDAELKCTKASLAELDWVDDARVFVSQLAEKEKELDDKIVLADQIELSLSRMDKIDEASAKLSKTSEAISAIEKMGALLNKVQAFEVQRTKIEHLLERLDDCDAQLLEQNLNQRDNTKALSSFKACPLCGGLL